MRGCFHGAQSRQITNLVFPAHAGVFLYGLLAAFTAYRLPRACGGVSLMPLTTVRLPSSSPRMRGCFRLAQRKEYLEYVFPAHAGVFPCVRMISLYDVGLPRACGGVSESGLYALIFGSSSPRMRGCFHNRVIMRSGSTVFPAHAGVFPSTRPPRLWVGRLPRACGGVSKPKQT